LCCEHAAFMEWKRHLEMKTLTTFVKARKDSNVNNCIRRSYYCSRSGRKRTTGRGIRHSRVQGSCKIGSFCPAAIFVRIAHTGMYQFLVKSIDVAKFCDKTLQKFAKSVSKVSAFRYHVPLQLDHCNAIFSGA